MGPRAKRLACLGAIACLAALASASPAAAAYTVQTWTGCPTNFIDSGSWDQAGNLYVPCGASTINVYDAAGNRVRQIAGVSGVSDVAPSPDGQYLYLARGVDRPKRMVRQGDGSYLLDNAWALAPYDDPDDGPGMKPRGHFIATDGAGNVYLADGAWTEGLGDDGVTRGGGTMIVVKYTAAGNELTHFGIRQNSWALGSFWGSNAGVVATQDGLHVYTTELNNSRVQRWDRQLDGSYTPTWSLGSTQATDPAREGGCPPQGDASQGLYGGRLAAPYDVALDEDGDLYVLNTTCHQVLKFTTAGELLYSKAIGSDATSSRPHSFSVSKSGAMILVQEDSRRLCETPASCPAETQPSELPATEEKPGAGGGSGSSGGGSGSSSKSPDPAPQCEGADATIVGTEQRDVLVGTPGADVAVLKGGDDVLVSLGGDDKVCAGAGADRLIGGGGADLLLGEAGADVLAGEAGKDQLRGGPGPDRLFGGPGSDTLDGGGGKDACRAGGGRDQQRSC